MNDLDLGATIKGFSPGQKVFNRYTLKKILGRGGMGVVWLAQDGELDREVALKFLPEIVALDPEALVDLKRETRRNLDLTHPHIVRIYDFVADSRTAAISMEYVNGASLSALKLDKSARVFTPDEIRDWLGHLTEALTYAHSRAKVVHRDLKPANLMITKDGDLKITDFGIARGISDSVSRVSAQAGTSGTPVYMSPQQMMGENPAVTDDIYALGATLYELLTGKPPFYSGNVFMQVQNKLPPSIAERRQELEVTSDAVPEHWEQTIAACLAKEPANRPQSMAEIAQRLGLNGRPVSAPVQPPPVMKPASSGRLAPSPTKPGPESAPGMSNPYRLRHSVIGPAAGWGLVVAGMVAMGVFLVSLDNGEEDGLSSALGVLVPVWLLSFFVIAIIARSRRLHREEAARLAADPAFGPVPGFRRWILAPSLASLPVALVVSGPFSGYKDFTDSLITLLVSWPALALFSLIVLAGRRPWGIRSPAGLIALGAILSAPLGLFAMSGDVGPVTLCFSVLAAGYLGGFGGWILHRLAVGVLVGEAEAQVRKKILIGLLLIGGVAVGFFFIALPIAISEVSADRKAVAARAEAARAEQERLAQEQARERRRVEANDLITAAVKQVFDRSPTPIELAEYTTALVNNLRWDAAGLRQAMRESPAGRKGGRLLVPSEFPTIQGAINVAVPGNAVHVAAGTYAESINLDKAVDLIGAGRDQVRVETDCTKNTLSVDKVSGITISGFSFRHTDTHEQDSRAFLVSLSGSSVRFAGNAVRQANGYGLWIERSGSSTVVDNIIQGSRWSGISVGGKGTAEIRNNEITANQGAGIIVSEDVGKVSIIGNEIRQSGQSGIWVAGGESVTLIDNKLSGNSASKEQNYGGILIGGGRPVLRGNVARDNKGGGIWWNQEKAQPQIGPGNFSDGKELPVTP